MHACAVRDDGLAHCWGLSDEASPLYQGQTNPPDDAFATAFAGYNISCGLSSEGAGRCWGDDGEIADPPIPLAKLDLYEEVCGLSLGGDLVCWNGDIDAPVTSGLVDFTMGLSHYCALDADHALYCWGNGETANDCSQTGTECGQADPPIAEAIDVDCGQNFCCAVALDGGLSCWGIDDFGQSTPPDGQGYLSVSAGGTQACALHASGTVQCWGAPTFGGDSPPQEMIFTAVSAGSTFNCGITDATTLHCWGSSAFGTTTPFPDEG